MNLEQRISNLERNPSPGSSSNSSHLVRQATILGHSYTDSTAGFDETINGNLRYNQSSSLIMQTMALLGLNKSNVRYLGKSGTILIDDAYQSGAYGSVNWGGWVAPMQHVLADAARAPYVSKAGLGILMFGINDVQEYGLLSSNKYVTNYGHALRSVISRLRAGKVVNAVSGEASISIAGTKTYVTDTRQNSGDGYVKMQSAGGGTQTVITITIPADYGGSGITLGFIGEGDGLGGTATITSSVATQTITTSNVTIAGNTTGMVVRLALPATGSTQTVQITCTSVAFGGSVDFNYWQIDSEVKNPIIVCNVAKLLAYTGQGSDAAVEAYNAAILSVCNEFTGVAVADWENLLNVDSRRISDDDIHPSELGASYLAQAILDAMNRVPSNNADWPTPYFGNVRSGLNTMPLAPLEGAGAFGFGTWLVQRGAYPDGSSIAIGNATNKGTIWIMPIEIVQPCTITNVTLVNLTTGSGGTLRGGIYYDYLGFPGIKLAEATTSATIGTNKTMAFDDPLVIDDPGLYWVAIVVQGGNNNAVCRAAVNPAGDERIQRNAILGIRYPSAYLKTGSGIAASGSLPDSFTDTATGLVRSTVNNTSTQAVDFFVTVIDAR